MAKLPRDTITHYEHDGKGNITVTMTDLIRCKDCKWWKNQDESTGWLPCMTIATPSDFYCGSAELRGEQDEAE